MLLEPPDPTRAPYLGEVRQGSIGTSEMGDELAIVSRLSQERTDLSFCLGAFRFLDLVRESVHRYHVPLAKLASQECHLHHSALTFGASRSQQPLEFFGIPVVVYPSAPSRLRKTRGRGSRRVTDRPHYPATYACT